MRIARVVGNVVSTIKVPSHRDCKLLIVQECDDGFCAGEEMIAIDTACAGEGDYVLMLDDGGSSRIMTGKDTAVDMVIVGVLDYLPWEDN